MPVNAPDSRSRILIVPLIALVIALIFAIGWLGTARPVPAPAAKGEPAITFSTLPPGDRGVILKKYNRTSESAEFVLSEAVYDATSLVKHRVLFSGDADWPKDINISRDVVRKLVDSGLNYYVWTSDPAPARLVIFVADDKGIDVIEVSASLHYAEQDITKGHPLWERFLADCGELRGSYPR